MTKLESLLQELCPDGVEFKTLGEIAHIERGASPRPIKNFITDDEKGVNWIKIGDVETGAKYVTSCKEHITQTGAKKSRFVKEGDFILSNSMSFGRPYILKINGCIHDGWLSISEFEEHIKSDFLYYVLISSAVQMEMKRRASFGGAVQNLNSTIVRELLIPVPPLPVQEEIVHILDQFTQTETELQNKITAEIEARKKQFEYFKNQLMTMGNHVEWKTIGSLTRVFSASRVHKDDWRKEGIPFYRSSDVVSLFNGVENPRGKAFISEELYEKLSAKSGKIKKDDILVTGGGSIGIPYVVPSDESLYVKDADLICIQKSEKVNSRFLYHYFLTASFRDYLKGIVHGSTIAHYTIAQILKTPIPVPPLDEQEKIVSKLEKLNQLFDDMLSNLTAELSARQTQYEYYRDKLLTFKARA